MEMSSLQRDNGFSENQFSSKAKSRHARGALAFPLASLQRASGFLVGAFCLILFYSFPYLMSSTFSAL
jgi:hypothetical protein